MKLNNAYVLLLIPIIDLIGKKILNEMFGHVNV
jgi:hypothetical protein